MTRRRPTARRTPARGGQQGYEPPVTRMRRDERILELALERCSQRQIAAEVGLTQGGAAATTVVELETQSAAGNPTYLAVEQRCDEFAAHLVGLYDRPALPAGALPPAIDPTSANVRLLGHLSTDTLERAHAELTRPPDQRSAGSDPA